MINYICRDTVCRVSIEFSILKNIAYCCKNATVAQVGAVFIFCAREIRKRLSIGKPYTNHCDTHFHAIINTTLVSIEMIIKFK